MTKRMVKGLGCDAESVLELERWLEDRAFPEIRKQVRVGKLDKLQMQAFIEGRNPFEIEGWILKRTKEVEARLKNFFGKSYNLVTFRAALGFYGKAQVERWEELGLQVTFLPEEAMVRNATFPGWKVKPNSWFYEQLEDGKLYRFSQGELVQDFKADQLEGAVVLFDIRCKPAYKGGKQMWQDDEKFLGPIIEKLRQEDRIPVYGYGSQSSRFGISVEPDGDWDKVRPGLSQLLGLEPTQVRLERAIEFNVLSQMYPDLPRARDGTTSTWLWFEEFFGGSVRRLVGGASDCEGLTNVDWNHSDE